MLLELDLYWDGQHNRFLEGLNSEAEAVLPEFPQGGTVGLSIHKLRRTANKSATLYEDAPWAFGAIRASLTTTIDGAPDTGSFKWKVGDEVSAQLNWPGTFANDAALATWKANALAALKALPSVGVNGVVSSDPPGTPSNFFYFTWTGDADERAIEVVANKLAPTCLPEVCPQRPAPGYQQLIKLPLAPLVMTTDFAFDGAAQPTISTKRMGQVGQNAIQRLTLPADTDGSFEVRCSGAPARLLTVPGVTSQALASALNALMPNGSTNPSFAVTAVSARVFDIEFIGPLGGSAQADLAVYIYPSVPPSVARGVLPLTSPRFERPLNGAGSCKLFFELVITDTDGESKIIRQITFVNSATRPETETDLEIVDAIVIRERVVIVNMGEAEAITTTSPGVSVSPGDEGSVFVVNHGYGSWQPETRVAFKISSDPEEWKKVPDNEYEARAITANSVRFSFTYPLSDDPEDPLYFDNFKLFVVSPDATVQLIQHQHTWTQVRQALPAGKTVAAKFDEIDAALGIVGGNLHIPASNIDGQLAPTQIDMGGVGTALQTATTFLTTLRTLMSDAEIAQKIGTALGSSTAFIDTMKTVVTNGDVLLQLVTSLLVNQSFAQQVRTLIVEIIQGTAGALGNMVTMRLPDLNEVFPALEAGGRAPRLPAAVSLPDDLGELPKKFLRRARASNAGDMYTIGEGGAELPPRARKQFFEGEVVFSTGTDWFAGDFVNLGNVTANPATNVLTVDQPHFRSVGDRVRFKTTDALPAGLAVSTDYFVLTVPTPTSLKVAATDGGAEVDITNAGTGVHAMVTGMVHAREFERPLFVVEVAPQMLVANTRFALPYQFSLQMLGANTEGFYRFTMMRCAPTAARAKGTNLASLPVLETIIDVPITVTNSATMHTFGYAVTCGEGGALTASKRVYTKSGTATEVPASASFVVIGYLSRFDVKDVNDPRGQVKLTSPQGQIASILVLDDEEEA